MQKILYFILLWACLFKHAYSQTIEITKISTSTSNPITNIDYTETPIEIYNSQLPYTIFDVTFTWDDFDPTLQQIDFSIWKDDGNTKTKINFSTFPAVVNGSTSINGSVSIQSGGNIEYSIQASYYDDNNQQQLLTESDSWTITIVPDPINQIYNNTICCNQITLVYPFNPTLITQETNTTVSTQDGAAITSIQWQKFTSNIWSNIPGATQMSYDPPSVNADTKYRRVLTSASGTISNSLPVLITKVNEIISGNSICCSQTTDRMPFDPTPLFQTNNTIVSSNAGIGTTFTYQWQSKIANGIWTNIVGATNNSYDPTFVKNSTSFRRIAFSSYGGQNASKPINASLVVCNTRPSDQQNLICGDQAFYRLQHGDIINVELILGSLVRPDIDRREFGYDYMRSDDGIHWYNIKSKHILDNYTNVFTYEYYDTSSTGTLYPRRALNSEIMDYQIPSFTFDINKGAVQHIYITRDYYHWYDEFNCGPFNLPGRCGAQWYFKNSSNIVKITLTTGDFPKPVPTITSSRNNVTCNWSDQTLTFGIPQLNNGEYYKWTIPSTWTLNNQSLEGYYVNNISVQTNSGDGNHAKGGQVCLEVTQGGQTDRQCITIAGSSPTNIVLPATIQGCEGQTVVIKPILTQNNAIANPANYNFSWQAYQSQNISCGTLNDCKELSLVVSNVRQNPTQAISVTVKDNLGCKTSANTVLVTAPGLQMGILNSYSDPKAISTSGLAINTANNYLYFTDQNKYIYRSYYDNTPGQLIWKYVPLKDKNTNQAITSDGPVAYYKGSIDKLFYIRNSNLYYAESTDNGLTWVDKFSYGSIAQNVDPRIKISANNIYYIDISSRKVFYQNITNSPSSSFLVGIDQVNYSQRMFTVEDDILSYADVNNNIVAFDANTGVRFTINVAPQFKQVNYNSSISTYNNNIYYTSSSGNLRILKKNISTGVYDNYEEVPNLQLAGPFAINKQTGTVYAKAYNVLGKQIYYLNNIWNVVPINSPLSYSAIQSDMTYTNEHAYYIGDNGYLSNTYYIAPCIPAVLRTSNAFDTSGDVLNDPLSNEITEDHSVLFYPNPTTGIVKATFTIPNESMVQIKIIPITGGNVDIIYNASIQAGTQEIPFDLSTYAAGIYIVQVYVDGSLYAKSKLIKY